MPTTHAPSRSGPFHRLVLKDSETLLVSFSSIDTPPHRFRPYRVPMSLPYSKLFVNCPDNQWYLGGIPSLGRCPSETIDSVRRLVGMSGCRRVVTYGGSMGGFGSILFGLDLGADLIIAHGAESIVGLRGSHSGREIRDAKLIERGRGLVRSWRQAVPRFGGTLHSFFGETDMQDGIHATYFHKLTGVCPLSVRCAAHDVERYIANTYGLERHLREIIEGHAEKFISAMCGRFPDVRQLAHAYRRRILREATTSTPLNPESAWPGTHMILLGDALVRDDIDTAVAIAEAAVRARPDFEYFHYALISLLLAAEARRKRCDHPLPLLMRRSYIPKGQGKQSGGSGPLHPVGGVISYHDHLVDVLERDGHLDAGVEAADQACRRFPGDIHLRNLRDRISSRRKA